ncbi:MAG: hypothetical protein M1814_005275 [Vezdaea aestivalis]|nr:MAG: hypothetical protein M1814_005275 [Vezdaea aestivalis]
MASTPKTKAFTPQDYSQWSHTALAARIAELEKQLRVSNARFARSCSPQKNPKRSATGSFNPTKYNTRYIALKFSYLGQQYNGFEYNSGNETRLKTIEEELWNALAKCRLIFPTGGIDYAALEREEENVNWDGTQYSKCGRTDKGVSAFGQVIGIRVRSNRPIKVDQSISEKRVQINNDESVDSTLEEFAGLDAFDTEETSRPRFDDQLDELPYPRLLNRILPPDIRILAWCPSPPDDFNARFSCRERQYRYFFVNPIFAPTPGATDADAEKRKRLDIEAMQAAAKSFEGLHDFRNFCKIDASKQITNFKRRIFRADIQVLDPRNSPAGYYGDGTKILRPATDQHLPFQVYCFTVHGSAFLWHQIRHMVAILFLVGQKLESPDIVQQLLDVEKFPGRPPYEKAEDAPLVLWDCLFPEKGGKTETETGAGEDALEWITVDGPRHPCATTGSKMSIVDHMWPMWQGRKIDEILTGTLLDEVASRWSTGPLQGERSRNHLAGSAKIFGGGNVSRLTGQYKPVCQRPQLSPPEAINKTYRLKNNLPESRITLDLSG